LLAFQQGCYTHETLEKESEMVNAGRLNVPLLDLQEQNRRIQSELDEAVSEVIRQAKFILGPAVERFEGAFADYIGRRFCIGLNSGTSALHMALQALDIGPGDEVITTPHTWISTSWAISYVGARPVFVDIDPISYNLDPKLVEQSITSRTRAILPVHLYGQACDLAALGRIAQKHGLRLIEDAAQAHGAIYAGRRVGAFGDVACFSFYPGKNLGCFGEAGAVVTDDEQIAARIRCLRDHAQDGRHNHVEMGYNTRMEGIQGAVLDVKLRHLDSWNRLRAEHARRYCQRLERVSGISLPVAKQLESHIWHLFVVLVNGADRGWLANQLAARGIATGVHYPTLVPLQPAYSHLGYRRGDFPVAEDVANRCLSLPMFAEMTHEQIDYVAAAVGELAAPSVLKQAA
jgi:dTDP-4-amino-4,6-dideoxygalactose transaminase